MDFYGWVADRAFGKRYRITALQFINDISKTAM